MTYILAAIAVIWLADGLALLIAPRQVIVLLRETLDVSPWLIRWETAAGLMGCFLVLGMKDTHLGPLWVVVGMIMMLKSLFLMISPEPLRQRVLTWCLNRDDVDYRFAGLGLCALAVLLCHTLGWLPLK